jgi:hypothetical protein
MAKKQLGEGTRVRAKDLFTLFTGRWGHEEFDSCGHKLIKIKFGSILADYDEAPATHITFEARKYGLVSDQIMRLRHMHSQNLVGPTWEFDPETRPRLRLLYKDMLKNVKGVGRKRLFNGQISWNILSFVTIGPAGNKCHWVRTNIGTKRDTAYVPLLVSIDRVSTLNIPINEQYRAVGDDFFGGQCNLTMKSIPSLSCAGI